MLYTSSSKPVFNANLKARIDSYVLQMNGIDLSEIKKGRGQLFGTKGVTLTLIL